MKAGGIGSRIGIERLATYIIVLGNILNICPKNEKKFQFVCNVDSLPIKCRLVYLLNHKSNIVIENGQYLLYLGSLKQPDLRQARALSSSIIYLAWEGGPIRDHPGGFRFGIYLKNTTSSQFQIYANLSGSTWKYYMKGLQANMKYIICVGTVDPFQRSKCHKVATVTTPAQKGKLQSEI